MERRKPKVNKSKLWECSFLSESIPETQAIKRLAIHKSGRMTYFNSHTGKAKIISSSRIQQDEICFPFPYLPYCSVLDLFVFLCLWFPHCRQSFGQTLLHLVEIQRTVQKGDAHSRTSVCLLYATEYKSLQDPSSLLPVTQWLLLLSLRLQWDWWS